MNESTLRERFGVAIEALLQNDRLLLEYNVGERSIASALHVYLRGVFPSHHVDVEYDKHGISSKSVSWGDQCKEIRRRDVVPDIVVHSRGIDARNLVVCEIKKFSASRVQLDCDRSKLRAIRRAFDYDYALLLVIPTGRHLERNLPSVEIVEAKTEAHR